uniref:G-protein coupled receptors family 1 profile domain-containing protein n=1 Tax=Anolis carolinensis TaxID=28377 RepID=H9GVS7_ANOCA
MDQPTSEIPVGRRQSHSCEALLWLPPGESPVISAVMFSAGLVGNLWALALLGRPPFRALLSALVLTDLLGTCLLSPAVLSAYATGRTLVALDGGRGRLCQAFAFGMSFFALATLCCLGAMALERSLALGAPYLYARLLGEAPAWLPWTALGALYALCAALCAAPLLLGFGRFAQYCPGTWCFLQMRSAFALLYAALLLLLVLAVLLGNLSLMASLLRLRRRGKGAPPARSPPGPLRGPRGRPPHPPLHHDPHLRRLLRRTLCQLEATSSPGFLSGGILCSELLAALGLQG